MKTALKTLAASALIASTFAFSAPAMAGDGAREFSFRIDRATLTNDNSVRATYQRLNVEAQRYCEALPFSVITTRASCRMDVVDYVVDAVDHQALKTLHDQRTRGVQLLADNG